MTPLLVEELVVISSSAAAPVTDADTIELAEVAALPQVVFSRAYDLRAATDAAFRAAGLTPRAAVEGAEMDAVLRFVERGLGVAVVPAMVLVERPGLRAVRLRDSTLTRTISLARPADMAPTVAVAVMQRTIARTAVELAAAAGETMRPAGVDCDTARSSSP